MKEFVETQFNCAPVDAVRRILSAHKTGQIVINVSEGTPVSTVWREKKVVVETNQEIGVDRVSV